MNAIASRLRLRSDSGFSLVELVVTMGIMGVVLGGLATIFVSGERASADATARMTSQQNVRVAFDRLEYDARCADTATLLNKTGSNGAGVYLHLPTQCAHASGTVTWCITSGSLTRNTGTTCPGTALTYVTSVTSATPFSCYTPVAGTLPQIKVLLTVNPSTRNSDKTSGTDYITMHNVPTTYNISATALPAGTITVASTAGFPTAGSLSTSNGTIAYTGTTATTFTGATGGTGTLAANAAVVLVGCS
ncbi:MAG: PilW family protein [Solirubrobacterales bacterium]|jgi:prepilin-type N-terminal cleavage/methylation domain-containing protein